MQAPALNRLVTPGGALASLAEGLTQPIFDGGTLRGQLDLAKGRYDELLADYRKAVVQAFTDVDTALTAWRYATEQEALQRVAVEAARRAATIAQAQMEAGTVDITTVLTAEDDAVQRRGPAGAGSLGACAGAAESVQGAWRRLGGTGSSGDRSVSRPDARHASGRRGAAGGRERSMRRRRSDGRDLIAGSPAVGLVVPWADQRRRMDALTRQAAPTRTGPACAAGAWSGCACWWSRRSATRSGSFPPRRRRPTSATAWKASRSRSLTAVAATQDVPIYQDGLGTVQAFYTVTMKAMVDGPLVAVNFKEGQDVHKGEVLAQIDPRTYQAALDNAVAKKAQDQAQLANARLDLARYQKLVANNYTSAQQADTAKAQVAQFEALVQQDQAQIDTARTQLSYTTIVSPIDGRTGMRQVDPGNIVHAVDHHRAWW